MGTSRSPKRLAGVIGFAMFAIACGESVASTGPTVGSTPNSNVACTSTPIGAPLVSGTPPPPAAPASTPSAIQLTDDDVSQSWPVVFGDRIAWADDRDGNADIFVLDLVSQTETRITTTPGDEGPPDLWEHRLVYASDRDGNYDIYLYDLESGVEQRLTELASDETTPRIWGDRVVYEVWESGTRTIYHTNIVAGTYGRLSASPGLQPDIWESTVVWVAPAASEEPEVFALDLTPPRPYCVRQMTVGASAQRPRIHGGKVVYENRSVSGAAPVDLLDLETGSITRLSPYRTIAPRIWGDRVVLADRRKDDPTTQVHEREVSAWNLVTGEETVLTWDDFPQVTPSIWENRIVWAGTRSQEITDDTDLYMVELAGN